MDFTNLTDSQNTNLFLNQIIFFLNELAEQENFDITRSLLLSGRVAAILQGAIDQPINNIVFVTTNQNLINTIRRGISDALPKLMFNFKTRTIYQTSDIVVEFWFNVSSMSSVDIDGYNLHLLSEIPIETL